MPELAFKGLDKQTYTQKNPHLKDNFTGVLLKHKWDSHHWLTAIAVFGKRTAHSIERRIYKTAPATYKILEP